MVRKKKKEPEQQGNGELEALFQALEGAGKRLEGADDDGDA